MAWLCFSQAAAALVGSLVTAVATACLASTLFCDSSSCACHAFGSLTSGWPLCPPSWASAPRVVSVFLPLLPPSPLLPGTVDPATLQLSQLSSHKCYKYTSWCTGEHELYDLAADPWEMQNIFRYADPRIIQRLDAALTVLAKCVGDECHNPAKYMHPTAGFTRFSQSLAPQYDVHYAQLPKFYFRQCLAYYTQKNEVGWFKPA